MIKNEAKRFSTYSDFSLKNFKQSLNRNIFLFSTNITKKGEGKKN